MIAEYMVRNYCSEDISLIDNYEQAINDKTQTWHCHHRDEITLSKSIEELIKMGLYWKVPASKLIFLTETEHKKLHQANLREETVNKIKSTLSSKRQGSDNPMWNKQQTEKTRKQISETMKNVPKSEETKANMRKAQQEYYKTHSGHCKGKHRVYHSDGTYHYEF